MIADRFFVRIRSSALLYRLTLLTRVLLAAGFVPTGMVKLLGQRFTTLPPDTPIGAFFEAMYQTGLFWRFIGAAQVVAGILLLVPPLAHLGALLFVPVVSCIAVVTVALDFGLTELVTALMLLAVLYLCIWDYHRWRGILTTRPLPAAVGISAHRLGRWERIGLCALAATLLALFARVRF